MNPYAKLIWLIREHLTWATGTYKRVLEILLVDACQKYRVIAIRRWRNKVRVLPMTFEYRKFSANMRKRKGGKFI